MRNPLDCCSDTRTRVETRAEKIIRLTRERDRLFREADREYINAGKQKGGNAP
jgi:hypothetical protein